MCLGKIMADSDHRVMSYDKLKLPNFQGPYLFNYFLTKMALWVLSALTFSYVVLIHLGKCQQFLRSYGVFESLGMY